MKLKALVLTTSILTPIAIPVFAQDADAWAGFYGGIGYSVSTEGDIKQHSNLHPIEISSSPIEVFAGYNWTKNQMVYGAELSYSSAGIWESGYENEYGLEQFVDLRGRVGYAMDNWLIYGVISASFAEYVYRTSDTAGASGYGVGIGASYKVTDNIFIGSEVLFRSLDTYENLSTKKGKGGSWNDNGTEFSTLSVKIGYLF